MLTQSTAKIICALGLMFTLLLGGTDLFGVRQVGPTAVMMVSLSQMVDYSNKFWPDLPELPTIIPVIMTPALVTVMEAINGFMIAKLRVAPFIAISDMSTIVYGINYLYFVKKPNNSQPIGDVGSGLTVLSSFKVFGQISFLVVIAVIAVAGVWFLLNKTMFGKDIYIVDGNPEAIKVPDINVSKVIITVFAIEPMSVELAGILEATRTGGANSAYGSAYEFGAISSCAVGGVSLNEGVGKVSGVIIDVLIFTFINYGFAHIGANSSWQLTVKGPIIYNTMALDMRKNS